MNFRAQDNADMEDTFQRGEGLELAEALNNSDYSH